MNNGFIKANTIGAGANGAMTENGAISYSTIGSEMLNQFGKAGTCRGRDIDDVWSEQRALWAENPEFALKFPFYLRMITRQSNIIGGEKTEKVQKGQGAKDESFKRLLWIAKYHPNEFYRNLWILPIVGSWKDLWTIMSYEGVLTYLDKEKFFDVIAEGIDDKNHVDLVKKYLPRIRSTKNCTTIKAKTENSLAKELANYLGWSYKEYRQFKSTGIAHEFQKVICKGLYSDINWNAIPGKALLSLVSGNFLTNHNLNGSYMNWIMSKPVAKFNGYPYELGMKLEKYEYKNIPVEVTYTVDKQFENLVNTGLKDNSGITGNVLCALDTSGSMTCSIEGGPKGLTSYDVCVSLGIYFSELNQGAFHNVVAMFDNTSELKTLNGSFTDKWNQIKKERTAWGGTSFQSLIDLIINTRCSHPEIPESDFPQTLLVVSDMQFNPSRYLNAYSGNEMSNAEAMIGRLNEYFSKEFMENFKVVWWFCAGRKTEDYPCTMDNKGMYMISGFDGSVVSLILGGEEYTDSDGNKRVPTMNEIIQSALSQEVLSLVR